jgi:hypothetical protein
MGTSKRKAQSISSAVLRAQVAVTYTPAKRLRKQSVSAIDAAKLEATLSNDAMFGWDLTSNMAIQPMRTGYSIRLLKRKRSHATKGERVYSTVYDCIYTAENASFSYRYGMESRKSRLAVDNWLEATRKFLIGEAVMPAQEELSAAKELNVRPSRAKALAMTASISLRHCHSNIPDRNPNDPVADRTSSTVEWVEFANQQASKLQQWIRRRDNRRAAKAMKKHAGDQKYRQFIMWHLGKYLKDDDATGLLLGGDDPEIAATFSKHDMENAIEKARHVADAVRCLYVCTLEQKPTTWIQCCQMATEKNYFRFEARTVLNWYSELHQTCKLKFKRSTRGRGSSAAKSPFAEDENLLLQFKLWARSDLEHLTVGKASIWVNEELLKDWTTQQLRNYQISYPVSNYVVGRWMREAGFRYAGHKKSYYVDRHEDDDVVEDRNRYVVVFQDEELYEHCWVQLPKAVHLKHKSKRKKERRTVKQERGKVSSATKIKSEPLDASSEVSAYLETKEYHYTNDDGDAFVEVHADSIYSYDANKPLPTGTPPLPELGGFLSVRRPPNSKPRVVFGQDEAIYRSSQLNESCWAIDGQQTLRSKGMGVGRMISAMCSREFGFGYFISNEELTKINEARKNTKYADEEAATYLFGNPNKKDLLESPFIRELEYGTGKDGYWTYKHMVIQIEDCIDAFRVLHPDFDCVFELDHSSGHNAERPDGLTTTSQALNWSHGGKQRHMRDSVLTADCIGSSEHDRCIIVGKTQHMVFRDQDLPPVLDPTCPKTQLPTGVMKTRAMTVVELRQRLEAEAINSDGKRAELESRCLLANLPTKLSEPVMTAGYVGTPKGAAHIAFERGFFDSSLKLPNGKKVSMIGARLVEEADTGAGAAAPPPVVAPRTDHRKKRKEKVKRDTTTSVLSMLKKCEDFASERPQIVYVVELKLGAFIRLTPKCHPEIAGRGIEYAWGYSKLRYRRDINDGVAAHIKENVKKALSRELITVNRIRKFARKARDYKLTYAYLSAMAKSDDASAAKERIEHITKLFKQHRLALDANYAFIANA